MNTKIKVVPKEDEEEPKRQFKGMWIPVEIWDHTGITRLERDLLAEIDALDDGEGCRASNKHLAHVVHTTEKVVANSLCKLRKLGLIVDRKFDGRRRWMSVARPAQDFIRRWRQTSSGGEESI